MRNRVLGLVCTLTFLFVGYAVAWFSDPNEIAYLASNPDAAQHIFEALEVACVFALCVLFLIVWPQAWVANWLVERFRFRRFFLLAFFFGMSSLVVCVLDFAAVDNHRLIAWLVGTFYLLASCFILWWISFRRKPAGYDRF
ncbi:MAG TPA: hypothetical protein VGY98_01985 [Verrucomicrobiae bacterium]|nr:hypothetical protein [Verrucomicrobiae bacterium]